MLSEEWEKMYQDFISSLSKAHNLTKRVGSILGQVESKKDKESIQRELSVDHLETKIKLLTEALNKWNNYIKELESNKHETHKEKILSLWEELELQRLKVEEYERQQTGRERIIDVDTIDGRINFLVEVLERYKN